MCSCSAGNEGGATLPTAKKYRRNAVKRVSCKQVPCFESAARKHYRQSADNDAGIHIQGNWLF